MDELYPRGLYEEIGCRGRNALLDTGGQPDPWLSRPGADDRMALTLVLRPSPEAAEAALRALKPLRRLEPRQYFYPASDLHITVLDLIPGQPGLPCPSPPLIQRYRDLLTPVLADTASFPVFLRGLTASENAVLVKGYYHFGTLDGLRARLREALAQGGLPARERYGTRSCHLTAMRLAAPVSDPSAFLNALRQLEDHPLGVFPVCQAELVYHDWYDARKQILASFPLRLQ